MKSSLISIFLVTLSGASLLNGCGDSVPVTAPQIVGYSSDQLQAPQQQAPVIQAEDTTSTPAKTTASGKSATSAKITGKTTTAGGKTITVKPAATTTASANSNLSTAQKIILKTKQTYDGFSSFTATFTMFSKRNDRVAPKGNAILTAETKYLFQAPRNEIFNVTKHSISMVTGAKMIWKGGDSANVKAGGVLGLFPMDLKLTDSKMTTNREWRLDQLDHVGILSRALDKKAELTLAGKSTINGKEAYMIKVKGTGLDAEVTEENIAVDTKSFTIIADEMYSGQDLVFQTKITIEGTNVPVPADAFAI